MDRYYTIRLATGWTNTGDYLHTETLLLELTAPELYGFAPTRIQFHSVPGPVHTIYGADGTAHSIAQQHATSLASGNSQAIASTVRDCTVGGEVAAVFGYSDGPNSGFQLFVVHGDLLFEIILFGVGGVGNQTIHDSLGMIASLTWTF